VNESRHTVNETIRWTDRVRAAAVPLALLAVAGKLESVLNSANHQWYRNRMDPAEKERREKQMQEFKQRYGQ
jgi:hypothetical protein